MWTTDVVAGLRARRDVDIPGSNPWMVRGGPWIDFAGPESVHNRPRLSTRSSTDCGVGCPQTRLNMSPPGRAIDVLAPADGCYRDHRNSWRARPSATPQRPGTDTPSGARRIVPRQNGFGLTKGKAVPAWRHADGGRLAAQATIFRLGKGNCGPAGKCPVWNSAGHWDQALTGRTAGRLRRLCGQARSAGVHCRARCLIREVSSWT